MSEVAIYACGCGKAFLCSKPKKCCKKMPIKISKSNPIRESKNVYQCMECGHPSICKEPFFTFTPNRFECTNCLCTCYFSGADTSLKCKVTMDDVAKAAIAVDSLII